MFEIIGHGIVCFGRFVRGVAVTIGFLVGGGDVPPPDVYGTPVQSMSTARVATCPCEGRRPGDCYCLQGGAQCHCSIGKGSQWEVAESGQPIKKLAGYAEPKMLLEYWYVPVEKRTSPSSWDQFEKDTQSDQRFYALIWDRYAVFNRDWTAQKNVVDRVRRGMSGPGLYIDSQPPRKILTYTDEASLLAQLEIPPQTIPRSIPEDDLTTDLGEPAGMMPTSGYIDVPASPPDDDHESTGRLEGILGRIEERLSHDDQQTSELQSKLTNRVILWLLGALAAHGITLGGALVLLRNRLPFPGKLAMDLAMRRHQDDIDELAAKWGMTRMELLRGPKGKGSELI